MRFFFGFSFICLKVFCSDLVVFSFNRPLQLYAFLESVEKNVSSVDQISAIYRASNKDYEDGYRIVFERFPYVKSIQQSNNNYKQDFKIHLIKTLECDFKKTSPYIVFAVDDIVIKEKIDFDEDQKILEKFKAYGFFYRLGKNITECYMLNLVTGLPPHIKNVLGDALSWNFYDGLGDWNYPNNLDFTLYRKIEVLKNIKSLKFSNPNELEAKWSLIKCRTHHGLCHNSSKIVNLPLNKVNVSENRATLSIAPEELLEIFFLGKKMDIDDVSYVHNLAPHMDYNPKFIDR